MWKFLYDNATSCINVTHVLLCCSTWVGGGAVRVAAVVLVYMECGLGGWVGG